MTRQSIWLNRWLKLRQSRALRWLVSVGLLLFFVAFVAYRFSGDWRQMARSQIAIRADWIAAAVALYGINFGLFLLVWQGIVVALGGSADWAGNAQVYCYTYLTRFLPTPAWFFAGRAYFSERIGLKNVHGLYATGVELGLHILTALVFYAVLQVVRLASWWYLAALALGLIIFWRLDGLERLLRNRVPYIVHLRRRDLALWSLFYLLTWLVAGPYLRAIVRAFVPASVGMWDAWRIWTLASLTGYVGFLLMGGMGFLREFSISVLLADYLLPADALVVAIGSRLILLGSGILWAVTIIVVIRFLSLLNLARPRKGSKES